MRPGKIKDRRKESPPEEGNRKENRKPRFMEPPGFHVLPHIFLQINAGKRTSLCPLYKGLLWLAQMVKKLPTMQETWVQSLGWEDLEKEMAIHSSILAWRIAWTEEPGGLQSMGLQRVGHD